MSVEETGAAASAAGEAAPGAVVDATATIVAPALAVAETTATTASTETTVEPSWRDRMAGNDPDFRKRLERFTDEAALARSYREMERKMASGELKAAPQPFPDKGTPEQQAQWRKDQGVPADPKEYKIALPDGIVLGEADKPGMERLTALAHKKNWSPDKLGDVMAAYYNELDAVKAQREQADSDHKSVSDDLLRNEWKGDYSRNLQAVNNFLDGAPSDVKSRLLGGRTSDGKLIANDPVMIKWLAQTALDMNPAATLLPQGAQNMQGISSRKAELETMMRDRRSEYHVGENREKVRQEYFDLLQAEEKMKIRAA